MLDDRNSNQLFIREEVSQWLFKISCFSVLSVDKSSLLQLVSKSSSSLKAILMSPSAVRHAVKQEGQSVPEIVATAPGHHAKCSRQYVLSVARKLKCLSNPVKVDRCIVVIATVRSDRANNASLVLRTYIGWGIAPMYFTRM